MIYFGQYKRTITSNGKIRIPVQWLKSENGKAVSKEFALIKSEDSIISFMDDPENMMQSENEFIDIEQFINEEYQTIIARHIKCTSAGWLQLPSELFVSSDEPAILSCGDVYLLGVGAGFDLMSEEQFEQSVLMEIEQEIDCFRELF